MLETQEDGTLITIGGPGPEPQNAVTGRDIWGDAGWEALSLGGGNQSVRGLTYPPAWQAIRQISGDGATLPCLEFTKDAKGNNIEAVGEPGFNLMAVQPNDLQTPSVFKEILWHHALWVGDGRAAIERSGSGMPAQLIPLLPDRTWSVLISDGESTTKFHITNLFTNFGSRGQGRQQYVNPEHEATVVLPDADVFHFFGLSYDGISGYDPSKIFTRTLAIGTGAEAKIQVSLDRGGIPPLVLIAPPGAFKSEPDAVEFLKNFNAYHGGIANTGKIGLLRNGITTQQLAGTNREGQFAQLKTLTRQDMAAIYNMPVQMLGDTDASTFNNLEQAFKNYDYRTLNYWSTRWEEEANRKLLTRRQHETRSHWFKYEIKPLAFTDTSERSKYYDSMRKNNAMSGNDINESEGRARVDAPEADSYANPNTSSEPPPEPPEESGNEDMQANAIMIRCSELAASELERIDRQKDCKHLQTFARRLDKTYQWQGKRLVTILGDYGGDTSRVAEYCSDRKQMILDRCATVGSHDIEPDDESDVSQHIYETFFGGNGKP